MMMWMGSGAAASAVGRAPGSTADVRHREVVGKARERRDGHDGVLPDTLRSTVRSSNSHDPKTYTGARKIMAERSRKGRQRRAQNLTAEERRLSAQQAARARWAAR
jgi:hypothetical protein